MDVGVALGRDPPDAVWRLTIRPLSVLLVILLVAARPMGTAMGP